MTTKEAIYLLRNTAWLAPSLEPIDEAIEMACDALDKVEYLNSQLGKADRKDEPTMYYPQVDGITPSVIAPSGKEYKIEPSSMCKDEPQTDVCDECIFVKGSRWCDNCNGKPKGLDALPKKTEPQTDWKDEMWKEAVEQREHDILYEPTYDIDDGRM